MIDYALNVLDDLRDGFLKFGVSRACLYDAGADDRDYLELLRDAPRFEIYPADEHTHEWEIVFSDSEAFWKRDHLASMRFDSIKHVSYMTAKMSSTDSGARVEVIKINIKNNGPDLDR